jgi:peptide-methionine (R)-S-oxide reductase
MNGLKSMAGLILIGLFANCSNAQNNENMSDHKNNPYYSRTDNKHLQVADAEWKKILPAEVYQIARLKGTEFAFSGKYYKTDDPGMYYCAVCRVPSSPAVADGPVFSSL